MHDYRIRISLGCRSVVLRWFLAAVPVWRTRNFGEKKKTPSSFRPGSEVDHQMGMKISAANRSRGQVPRLIDAFSARASGGRPANFARPSSVW